MPLDPSTPDLLWTAVADRIRDDLSPMVFGAWFSTTRALALEGDVLEVGVPNEFTRSWIEGHFSELVRKAASAADPGVSVRFRVTDGEPARRRERAPQRSSAPPAKPRAREARAAAPTQAEPLRSKYTFGSFVIGSSNRFAHAAALAVAEAPGPGLQPARHLRRHRPRQDAPAAGDRPLRAHARARHAGALRHLRGLHERVHRRHQGQARRRLQAALPRGVRRPPDRRHPVPGGQGRHPGGVLPHLQHAARERPAAGAELRPRAARDLRARRPPALALRMGPAGRRPAARHRDAHRDPAQARRRGSRAHRRPRAAAGDRSARARRTSASSRARSRACSPTPR